MFHLREFAACVLAVPCFAASSIDSIEPTQMQAKITVRTDQAGFCSYRASRGTSFTTNIPDLIDNTNTDARLGSILNGNVHVFVLGTRKGTDALAAAAKYWIGVTCGSDSEISATFSTRPIQWGNTAPDPIPFNASKFGNMDYPVIDWTDQQKAYVDPVTGVEFWRVTSPGVMNISSLSLAAFEGGVLGKPIDTSGTGTWQSVANIRTNGASFSVGSGGSADRAFVPLGTFTCPAGGLLAGWAPHCNVDDVSFDVYCGNAAAAGTTITLQLSLDGGQTLAGNAVTTPACPSGAPAKLGTYPQLAVRPLFQGWGFIPPHHLVVPPSGIVNVSSSTVTLQSPGGTQNYFDTDWAAGTPILINDIYYHISSVSSSTRLTIAESAGTLNAVPYVGAAFGVVVTKSNGGSNASVSLGLNYAYGTTPNACCNGDIGMMNLVPVSVSKTADGSANLNPALKGYLTNFVDGSGGQALALWVPFNSDGSVRAETRLLAMSSKPPGSPRLNTGGDSLPFGPFVQLGYSFDNVDGASAFALDSSQRVWKLRYDETLSGCEGYVAFHPYPSSGDYNPSGNIADDCFQWTNLAPTSTGHDLRSQMTSAYQTGQNLLNQTVGSAHPGFDLGWMSTLSVSGFDAGYFSASITNLQNHVGITASFDVAAGVLRSIRNSWSEGACRWCGLHSMPVLTMGVWRFGVIDPHEDSGLTNIVFPDTFKMSVAKVNRAGSGAVPVWDCNGCSGGPQNNITVGNNEAYTCPNSLLAPYTSFSGTSNCIQVKVTSPPCQRNPNSTYTFPDGKTERDEFPCTTPGFGVANSSWSKLQNMQAGDWVLTDAGHQGENLVILLISYNDTNDIDLWLLRWAGHNYINPLFDGRDDINSSGHSDPWILYMGPTYATNSTAIDASNPNGTWVKDNPIRFAGHGAAAPGSTPGLFSYLQGWFTGHYIGAVNKPVSDLLWARLEPSAPIWPPFAGSSKGAPFEISQAYNSGTYAAHTADLAFFVDYRHFNPSNGGGYELNGGAGFGSMSLTLVAGTSKTYRVAADCCANGSSDYKRLGLSGFAGRYMTRDVSSPNTTNTGDLADWSHCRAFNADECIQGSSPGNLYMTLPKVDLSSQCASSQFTQAIPCLFQPSGWTGQSTQVRLDVADSSGWLTRKFGYVHNHPGTVYGFSNCRPTPDAQFMLCPGDWLDGVRSEWLAYRIAPMLPTDSVNRTGFVPITLTYPGAPFATGIRARFGYLENGGDLLRCTAYGQDCSTEIPASASSDPYSFTNETVTRQNCANGATCVITIPSLANRVLYYVVDRLDGSGNVVATGALQAVAVP